MIDACCTYSNVVNAGVAGPNLTKFVYDIEKFRRLICWNQNCDIRIHLGTPLCWTKVSRQTVTESWQKLYTLPS